MGGHSLSSSSSLMCGSLYAQIAQGPFQTHLILARRIVRNPVAGSANSIYPLCQNFKQTFVFYRIAQKAPNCSQNTKGSQKAQNCSSNRLSFFTKKAPNCTNLSFFGELRRNATKFDEMRRIATKCDELRRNATNCGDMR